jgi:hypothetical protein
MGRPRSNGPRWSSKRFVWISAVVRCLPSGGGAGGGWCRWRWWRASKRIDGWKVSLTWALQGFTLLFSVCFSLTLIHRPAAGIGACSCGRVTCLDDFSAGHLQLACVEDSSAGRDYTPHDGWWKTSPCGEEGRVGRVSWGDVLWLAIGLRSREGGRK